MERVASGPITEQFTVLDHKPGAFQFGVFGNLMVACWTDRADGDAVERLARVTRGMAARHRNGFSGVHIVGGGLALPTAEARAGFIDQMSRYADTLACVGVVVGGTGFGASAMRSFITGMRVVSPWSFDFRISGAIAEVGAWLPPSHLKRTGIAIASSELISVLEDARRLHEAGEAARKPA